LIAHTILEGIGDAIYGLAPDWSVTFFNGQAERFFERSRTEVVGRSLWDSFPAARESELAEALRGVMESRQPRELVTLSRTTGRWADTRIFPLEDGGIAVSWRDVTAERRQAQALAEATRTQERLLRQLRMVTDHIPAMVGYWDRDLICRFANARYEEWFGRSKNEMLGLSIREVLGEDLFARNEPYIRGALGGERQTFERSLRKPSGEMGHTWAQYIPDTDASGQVLGFYVLVTDVTPLKEAEQQLQQVNLQLIEARKEAEAAASAKSAFLSNMSHELRNPLTSVIGYVDLLSRRADPTAPESRYLRGIKAASAALLRTLNDILDFSKLESGRVEIERRPVDPVSVGELALEMFRPAIESKGLTHRFEAVDVPAQVIADEARIRQILVNLIGNAVKFTSTGSIGVRCLYDAPGQSLRFEVIDTGPGIAAEDQGRLFQRFSQVDASTSRTFGGTGLGLAICKGLAEAMGGQVGVRSAPVDAAVEPPKLLVDQRHSRTLGSDTAAAGIRGPNGEVTKRLRG
jgi:PAS domain S-box-containing protein